MRKRVHILGVPIDVLTMEQALAKIEEFIAQQTPHQIVTANAEMVMLAQEDKDFNQILQEADLVSGDGAGVVWASGKFGSKLPERVTGVDLVTYLLPVAAQRGYRLFLLGSAPGVAETAGQKMQEKYPDLKIVGTQDGYFQPENEQTILEMIKQAQPDILLVALGFPRQEKWIKKQAAFLKVPVAVGVGGTLDVFAGKAVRAPLWMQKSNLEWLYRLLKEPQRALRMLALPKFVLRVLGTAGKGERN